VAREILVEREGLLVCTSGYSGKSSKKRVSLLVGKGHSRREPAGGLEPPSSMSFRTSHCPPAAVIARIASFPSPGDIWHRHTLLLLTCTVNALCVTDLSFFNHEGTI
jgi:hypothetical protein